MFQYDRFEELRSANGITKKFIADAISRKAVVCQDWKYGKSCPNDEQLVIIAKILKTTPEYLRGETDNPEQKEKPASENGDGREITMEDIAFIEAFRSADTDTQAAIRLLLARFQD